MNRTGQQAQYSISEQLVNLQFQLTQRNLNTDFPIEGDIQQFIAIANLCGLYDAADLLRDRLRAYDLSLAGAGTLKTIMEWDWK